MHKRFNYFIKFIVLQGATKLEQQYLLKFARSLLFLTTDNIVLCS